MPKNTKKTVRYSNAVATFICDKVESGITLAEIARKYADKVPSEQTVYRWRRTKPEFKSKFDTAYQTFLYVKIDEMEDLSKMAPPSVESVMKDYNITDHREAKIQINSILNQRRLRVDTLKFISAKLAPKLIPELSDRIHVESDATHTINVINYSTEALRAPPVDVTNILDIPSECDNIKQEEQGDKDHDDKP